MNILFVTFYCACLLLVANCDKQAVQNDISERTNPKVDSQAHGEITRSESDRVAYDQPFVKLPWRDTGKNFEQIPTPALKDLSKGELATFEKELLSIISESSKPIDFKENQLRPNPRSSVVSQPKVERNSLESGFPSEDRDEDARCSRGRQLDDVVESVASPFKSVIESLLKGKEGGQQPWNLLALFDPRMLLNLPDFLFKNGNSENVGLPGQPVRKFVEFLREKMMNKQQDKNEDRPEDRFFLRRFFKHGRRLSGNVEENV